MSRCHRCQRGEAHFIEHGTSAGYGFHGCRCEECFAGQSRRNAEYRRNNGGRIRAQQHERYEADRARKCAEQREYYYRNVERVREANRSYYEQNRERLIAAEKARYERNRDYILNVRKPKQNKRDAAKREYTRSVSKRSGDSWSAAEDALILNSDLPRLELALVLNRTLDSIKARRAVLMGHKQAYGRLAASCANGHKYEEGSFKLDSIGRYRCLQCLPLGAAVKAAKNRNIRVSQWLASDQDWDALLQCASDWGVPFRTARAYLRREGCTVPDGRKTDKRREEISRERRRRHTASKENNEMEQAA